MSLKITVKIAGAKRKMAQLQKKVPQELAKAINKVATASRRSMTDKFAKENGAKKKNIRKLLLITRADGRNPRKLFAIIRIFGKKLSTFVMSKKTKQTKQSVTARVAKKSLDFRKHFIATMKNGHTGIFKRAQGVKRLKIIEQTIDSNPEIFKDKRIGPEEDKKNDKLLRKLFNQNLNKLTRKFNLNI